MNDEISNLHFHFEKKMKLKMKRKKVHPPSKIFERGFGSEIGKSWLTSKEDGEREQRVQYNKTRESVDAYADMLFDLK